MSRTFRKIGTALCLLTGAVVAGHAQGRSQAAPPVSATAPVAARAPGRLPDVVGLRPGMGIQEAYALLKAYDPKAKLDAGQTEWLQLGAKPIPHRLQLSQNGEGNFSCELIDAEMTLPPTKQVVWRINRRLWFVADGGCPKEMTAANIMAGLREKYGPESSAGPAPGRFDWLFDEQGQHVSGKIPPECGRILAYPPGIAPLIQRFLGDTSHIPPTTEKCRLIGVSALIQGGSSPGLVRAVDVSVTNPSLGVEAEYATRAFSANVDATAEKHRLDEAGQQAKPKF